MQSLNVCSQRCVSSLPLDFYMHYIHTFSPSRPLYSRSRHVTAVPVTETPKELLPSISFDNNRPHRIGVIRAGFVRGHCYRALSHPFSLLQVQQPHHTLLTALTITFVTSCGEQSYSFGIQELTPKHFFIRGRDHKGLE